MKSAVEGENDYVIQGSKESIAKYFHNSLFAYQMKRNGEEEEHRSSEPHVTSSNRENAEKLEKDIRERADWLFRLIREAETTADWRNIRRKLNNLSHDIESLMRYLEAAEDEESEE